MTRIALDAFGSDLAPLPEVGGAVRAVMSDRELEVILLGPKDRVLSLPEFEDGLPQGIQVQDSEGGIPMEARPSEALKKHQNSSLGKGIKLLKEGKVRGLVSAGNTGAIMAFSLFILGRIPGIKRPAIAATIPSTKGEVLLIDAGANSTARPLHLLHFSIMATHYVKLKTGNENPRVGLLSVGTEEGKGNPLIEETVAMMKRNPELNFIGLVEGNAFFTGVADVIVTDGFTGNVILKFGEGVAEMLFHTFKGYLSASQKSPLGEERLEELHNIRKKLDYQEYGGAPLLGVNGTVIISHGKSTPRAIETALLNAKRMADLNIIKTLRESISRLKVENFL